MTDTITVTCSDRGQHRAARLATFRRAGEWWTAVDPDPRKVTPPDTFVENLRHGQLRGDAAPRQATPDRSQGSWLFSCPRCARRVTWTYSSRHEGGPRGPVAAAEVVVFPDPRPTVGRRSWFEVLDMLAAAGQRTFDVSLER